MGSPAGEMAHPLFWCPEESQNFMSQRVLIVEDEPNARMGLAELISGWGYATEVAEDGVEALERIQDWHPTILVSDLKMPRMDGLTLLSHLVKAAGQAGCHYADRAGQYRKRCGVDEAGCV